MVIPRSPHLLKQWARKSTLKCAKHTRHRMNSGLLTNSRDAPAGSHPEDMTQNPCDPERVERPPPSLSHGITRNGRFPISGSGRFDPLDIHLVCAAQWKNCPISLLIASTINTVPMTNIRQAGDCTQHAPLQRHPGPRPSLPVYRSPPGARNTRRAPSFISSSVVEPVSIPISIGNFSGRMCVWKK